MLIQTLLHTKYAIEVFSIAYFEPMVYDIVLYETRVQYNVLSV